MTITLTRKWSSQTAPHRTHEASPPLIKQRNHDHVTLGAPPSPSNVTREQLQKLCQAPVVSQGATDATAAMVTIPGRSIRTQLPALSPVITAVPRAVIDASSISGRPASGPNPERVTAFDVYWQDTPNSPKVAMSNLATSGNPLGDSLNPKKPYEGRTPAGTYSINCNEITDIRSPWKFRATWGVGMILDHDSWGSVRVPLHASPGTNTWGRSDFFLHGHGDTHPGTAGCVGLPNADAKRLFNKMEKWSLSHPGGSITMEIL